MVVLDKAIGMADAQKRFENSENLALTQKIIEVNRMAVRNRPSFGDSPCLRDVGCDINYKSKKQREKTQAPQESLFHKKTGRFALHSLFFCTFVPK